MTLPLAIPLAIARREIGSYFFSPVAYVALGLFLLACGYFFQSDLRPGAPVAMRSLFDQMVWLLVFIIPTLSMGLLATEWDKGTIETLMTAPVSETDVVVGKFLGSMGFFVVLLLPTLAYVALLSLFSGGGAAKGIELGPLLSGYLGIVLVGGLYMSVGLLCSSLTRLQMVAAVSCAAVLSVITIVPAFAARQALLSDFWRTVVRQLVYQRYTDFSRGVIDLGHVTFFLASTAVMLFLTVKVLESRRWK